MKAIRNPRFFFQGNEDNLTFGTDTCCFCGEKFKNHGVSIEVEATYNGREGFYLGTICGPCMISGPDGVKAKSLSYAMKVRDKAKRLQKRDPEEAEEILSVANGSLGIEEIGKAIGAEKSFAHFGDYPMAARIAEFQAGKAG